MTSAEIRQKFLNFFSAAEHGAHAVVPSSSLIPDDPSVLLTSAGMQQFKPYYAELDPETTVHPLIGKPIGKNATSSQKSFRTSDIDEVGDERHLTFFEMLGNFSFGGYFKDEAIKWAHEFITKEMGLPISYVTVFKGMPEIGVPKDEESRAIWNSLGITDVREEGMEDVFWGPTGSNGPCGPTTEIYCKNSAGQDIEVWNIVFNEFLCSGSREELEAGSAKLSPLKSKGIDTGMGFERLVMVSQNTDNIFDTDLFQPLMALLPADMSVRERRIVADHARATAFLISDGVRPSNKGAGYVLRRLMRRAIVIAGAKNEDLLREAVRMFVAVYPNLDAEEITSVWRQENEKFLKTLKLGLKELVRLESVEAPAAFKLYESYGLPYEVIKEYEGGARAAKLTREAFEEEFKKHQEVSRAGQEKKFGGHGLILDTGELKAGNEEELKKVTRLHTATHLLQKALRDVLGPEVGQRGSDITVERTRFDFAFPRKLTPEELKKTEDIVNEKIKEDLPVGFVEMDKEEAVKTGALFFFKEKYPDRVKVYFVGKDIASAWSKEFCGGPHVTHTGEVGHFRIAKEETVGAGIRRIRGVVE
jgi:alanyl-tRNA synthetase